MHKIKYSEEHVAQLSKVLSEKAKESIPIHHDNYQLVNIYDDLMLVWCKEEVCFYAQILQNAVTTANNNESCKIQVLALSKPPFWDVKQILVNKSGTRVLLLGKEGLAVVELPKRWGSPPLFEGGVDTLTCRVESVGEQFCNPRVSVISADWHPGSLDDSVIIVLSSDNYLRIYNISHLDTPEQSIAVASSSNFSGGKLGVGETVVAFGIGPPICSEENSLSSPNEDNLKILGKMSEETDEQKKKFESLEWPLFVLHNNGDVFYTIISLNRKSLKRRVLYGPLSMAPAAFDNYGLDFCSLLVLPSSPVVLVIANTKGYLHHCIVMDNEEHDPHISDIQQLQELSHSMRRLNLETSRKSLHVYESIHLTLSFARDPLVHTSPLTLIPDPNTPARYWVSHQEGIHGVGLPLVERLMPEGSEFPEWDLESHVEHFVCTRPITSVKHCPIVGLTISRSPCSIFVLLRSGNIHVIPLPSIFIPNMPYISMESNPTDPSQLRKALGETFENHIRSILQRSSSQPLLMSGSNPDIDPEEYLNLLTKVVDTLRENYVQPQIKAHEEIKRRRSILLEQKGHLQREMSAIQDKKKTLTANAHELAEKYEEANDRHAQIMKRLEVVIGHLVRKLPVLSTSENAMLKELEDMMEKSKTFSSELTHIHSKHQWQLLQIEKEKANEELKSRQGSSLSENQLKCLKLSLSKESDKLKGLVKHINQVKKDVGL